MDIPLKFPLQVSGKWNAIGIVDAEPEDEAFSDLDEMSSDQIQHVPPFMRRLSMMPESTNETFGRQETSFGLSPLVIYREVSW